MPYIKTSKKENGKRIKLYYESYGSGQTVILIHGWPLSHKMWEGQIDTFVSNNYNVIAYDRRGFGQSSKPWKGHNYDQFASDLNDLIETLKIEDAILVGFSMGGGEVARYLSTYGTQKVSKAVLLSAVTPYMLKSEDNPSGVEKLVFTEMKNAVKEDRPQFLKEFGRQFVNYTENSGKVSEAQLQYLWNIAVDASPRATLKDISAFEQTDFRKDLTKIDIPVSIIHGDADQICPVDSCGALAHQLIEHSELHVIQGAPHGLFLTHKNEINDILLDFVNGSSDRLTSDAAPSNVVLQ